MEWTPDEQAAYWAKYEAQAGYPEFEAAVLKLCTVIGAYGRMHHPPEASRVRLRQQLAEALWLLDFLCTDNDDGVRLGVDETTGTLRNLTPAEQAAEDAEAEDAEEQALFAQSLEAEQDANQICADIIHRVVDQSRRRN